MAAMPSNTFERWAENVANDKCNVVVLISGNGSNLQALIDQARNCRYRIVGVVCNNPSAYGLQRAKQAGIPTTLVNHRQFADREEFDKALLKAIQGFSAELVVLAGFMRILGTELVQHFHGRMINIHPSLLPKHRGMNTHRRVLEKGDSEHGLSIHFVDEQLDGGPIIAQSRIKVRTGDSEKSLAERILALEHCCYPEVVEWFATGRLKLCDGGVFLDRHKLLGTGLLLSSQIPLDLREDGASLDQRKVSTELLPLTPTSLPHSQAA